MTQYDRLREIANQIENIRIELFTSQEHKNNLIYDTEFNCCDDELFRIQSEIRDLLSWVDC